MRISRSITVLLAVAAAIAWLSGPLAQEALAQGGNFRVDSFFDITYTVEIGPLGGIGVTAVGVRLSGERGDVPTQLIRIIRAGEITKIYVSHPSEEAVTEIELLGRDPHITGLKVTNPKKHKHRGHVTVLK